MNEGTKISTSCLRRNHFEMSGILLPVASARPNMLPTRARIALTFNEMSRARACAVVIIQSETVSGSGELSATTMG
jgi:hypothetical protein